MAIIIFSLLVIFGLVPWAKVGAWSGLLAGLLGLITLIKTLRAHRENRLPFGTMLGLSLTGAAALALSLFLLSWDLGPL